MRPCLYLIRHGETEWSRTGRHTSRTELPLTPAGELAAGRLGERLRGISFSRVFTSPRLRARQTCAQAGLGGVAAIEPDLAEWDYGGYEGLCSEEIHRQRPGWDIFQDGCPGGESPAGVSARADGLLARLRQLTGNIALFSHGHFGRVLGVRWIGLPVAEGGHFSLGPAALSILGSQPDCSDEPMVVLWNAGADDFAGFQQSAGAGEKQAATRRAIQRWENEGGEIPPGAGPS